MKNKIDVIIPTFNRPKSISNVVSSILPQLKDNDAIYVVWHGSQKPLIKENYKVHIIHCKPPYSLPRLRNFGIKAGCGDILVFLDDDIEAGENLLEAHRESYFSLKIGAVAGRIIDPYFKPEENRNSFFDEKTGYLLQNFCKEESGPAISVMGANMSFRRSALEEIGAFDENFLKIANFEEVDAAFRIRNAGYEIWYNSKAIVKHLREESGGCRIKSKTKNIFYMFLNTAYFASRYAPKKYLNSWLTYWKYRLEYETRSKVLWFKHNPFWVLAGIIGAAIGIFRYILFGIKIKIDKKKLFNV